MSRSWIYAIGLLFLVSTAAADGWNGFKRYRVTQIIMEGAADGSQITIRIAPNLTGAETSCGDPTYIRLDASGQRGQYMMSALFSAQARDSEFHIATSGCEGNRPKMVALWTLE